MVRFFAHNFAPVFTSNTFQKKIAVSKTNEFLEFFAVVFGEFIDVLLVIT
jgi:hypothetical protein